MLHRSADALAEPSGWAVVVDHGRKQDVYDIAITDSVLAVEALKKAVEVPNGSTVRVRSQLSAAKVEALKMQPGDVRCRKSRRTLSRE